MMNSIIDEDESEATFVFKKSKEINTCIMNTIRRVAISNLNIFAFPDSGFNIPDIIFNNLKVIFLLLLIYVINIYV